MSSSGIYRQCAWAKSLRHIIRTLKRLTAATAVALVLGNWNTAVRAADDFSAWKIYQEQNCALEFRYPAPHEIKSSSAKDYCALSVSIRGILDLDVEEMDSANRQAMTAPGKELSAHNFALARTMARCVADGPDGSTYCAEPVKESSFKTAQGFNAYEFYLTEVRKSLRGKTKVEKRVKGPIIAVDISDDEVIRVALVTPSERSLQTAKVVVNTLRVWSKARRQEPRIVEFHPFAQARGAFVVRVVSDELSESHTVPPHPPINVFITDPAGHRRGVDPVTRTSYAERPAITLWTAQESSMMLQPALEGRYELQITADLPSVRYRLIVQAPDQDGKPSLAEEFHRTAEAGAIDRYELLYSSASPQPVKISLVKDVSRLTLLLTSSKDGVTELVLVDPRGKRTGVDPTAGANYREIPRSSYLPEDIGQRTMVLDIRQPMDGEYEVQVIGTGTGNYALDIQGWDRNGDVIKRLHFRSIPTDSGTVHRYLLNYSPLPNAPISISGGFKGDGHNSTNANAFLSYANPTGAETRLRAGQTTFPLLIFYDSSIRPVTFTAMLNDTNISSRFTPAPGTFEMVLLPSRPGSNTLALSVAGTTSVGHELTDNDRLMFWVP